MLGVFLIVTAVSHRLSSRLVEFLMDSTDTILWNGQR